MIRLLSVSAVEYGETRSGRRGAGRGADVEGGAIDLLRVPRSQISSPIPDATNHIAQEQVQELSVLACC